MPLRVRCPHCNHAMGAPDHMAGRMCRCPTCHQVLRLPPAANTTQPAPTKDRGGQAAAASPILIRAKALPADPQSAAAKAPAAESRAAGPFDIVVDDSRAGCSTPSYRARRKRGLSREASWAISAISGLVILAIIFAIRFLQRDSTSDEVREAAYGRYAEFGDEKAVRAAVDRYHDKCFKANYRLGGRRTRSTFDVRGYAADMDRLMLADPTLDPPCFDQSLPFGPD